MKIKEEKIVKKRWIAAISVLTLATTMLGGCAVKDGSAEKNEAALAEAVYPENIPYPDESDYVDQKTGEISDAFWTDYEKWSAQRRENRNRTVANSDRLYDFFSASMKEFLSDTNGENRIYSPVNVYMALAMLAEITDGESRAQILALLGADDMESLRTQASSVWNANYCKDGTVTSVLANSLWLNEKITYKQETLDLLAEIYYASSYQGEMGSDAFNRELQNWLNEQTGGLLEEQAEGIKLSADTILALASTLYYQAKWGDEFWEEATAEDVFHAPEKDVNCDFMHQSGGRSYYRGDRFSAVPQYLENSGNMWLILPDEGVMPEELLEDGSVMKLIRSGDEWEDREFLTVNLSMPKFDVASNLDLIDGLKKLGITDVFDREISDFTPITKEAQELYVSKAEHAARVKVDEEGCTAAAYTVLAVEAGAVEVLEEVDFVLDRPFLFVITGESGMPLFSGVVNQPI